MIRSTLACIALFAAIGCAGSSTDAIPDQPSEGGALSSPDAFAGTWRSVTPSLEFIRLSVVSKSSQQGVMGAQLKFSGVVWEGAGRITGDSVVADMSLAGTATASGVIVARASDAQTLRLQVRPVSASAIDLTFVREY